jgi:hypothetical protein
MKFDPRVTFWLGIITTLAQGIANGTVHLTGLIPAEYVAPVTGWMGLIAFINVAVLTAMSGMSSTARGPLAPPPTIPEARQVMAEATAAASH